EFSIVDCRTELDRLRQEGDLLMYGIETLLDGPYLRTTPGLHACDGFFRSGILDRRLPDGTGSIAAGGRPLDVRDRDVARRTVPANNSRASRLRRLFPIGNSRSSTAGRNWIDCGRRATS